MKLFNVQAISSLALIFDKQLSLKGKQLIIADNKNITKLKKFLQFKKTNFKWHELVSFPLPKNPYAPRSFLKRIRCQSYMIEEGFSGIFLATAQALLKKTSSDFNVIVIKKGDLFPYNKMKSYNLVEFVEKPGDFSSRSFLIDIFSPAYETPLRIELLEDSIMSIHLLSSDFKRRVKQLDKALISPLSEWNLAPSLRKDLCDHLRKQETLLNVSLPKKLYQSYSRGEPYFGFEALLNTLSNQCCLDYFSEFDAIYLWEPEKVKDSFFKEQMKWEKEHPFFTPKNLFLDWEILEHKESFQKNNSTVPLLKELKNFFLFEKKKNLKESLDKLPVSHIVFVGSQVKEMKKNLIKDQVIESVDSNFLKDKNLIFIEKSIPESFVEKGNTAYLKIEDFIKESKQDTSSFDSFKKRARALEFSKLEEGDLLIHKKHGLGEFKGLKSLFVHGSREDFIVLKYKEGDKLFVPAYKVVEIKKYSKKLNAKITESLLDSLGNPSAWERKKSKAKKHIHELAIELIELYKIRKQKKRPKFLPVKEAIESFEKDFPWKKTLDQKKSIQEIMSDMNQDYVMDRLLIGDTGFGKTEVALTAVFRALENNYQVCFLAPTTVLSLQHFKNFKQRFKNTVYELSLLNRFVSKKEKENIFKKIKEGKIDFLITTHSVFNWQLSFKNLGLLVLDEEHRFGVKQKERLFRFRKNLDVLSLSATPIPRTLNMALTGIKDISVIAQPPEKRKSVKIFLKSWNSSLEKDIKDACYKEKLRGGQVIYIYNRVKTLYQKAKQISQLLPDFKIAIVHGQTKHLDHIMLDFFNRKYDLLISTNIVESGMDIPQANTLFIDRVHEMGLSQIYQLKGRVGRSVKQAYCYLLYPEKQKLSGLAQERLKLLKKYSSLGSSFHLALHDLENRGAGSLFGSKQSGHIHDLGEEFYFEILNESLKNQKEIFIEPEIRLPFSVGIPSHYISDPKLRLLYYKNLSESSSEERFIIQNELLEEFGPFPEELKHLFFLLKLREFCKKNLIKDLKASFKSLTLVFHEECKISSENVIQLLKTQGGEMLSQQAFKIFLKTQDFFKELNDLLKNLTR
ncbi:MAG: DEAD/DEAH box helicase [Bdellovibrionales bacterium]|nr:DEAD/DEAH box helicase [Bdellovibrionales bacterium]